MTLGFGILQLVLGLFVTVIFFYILLKIISDPKPKKQQEDEGPLSRAKKHWETTPPDDIL